uniref:TGF-beta activated kinase 1 (MAP3K7) binding protein 1 n=1 Tax=Tetraodon nigroviridis TaxID=99883 RepID=H3DNB2_TETNG
MAAQRRNLMQSHQSWTDDLPLCQMCGVGTTPNCVYGPDGKGSQSHSNEDGHVRFRGEDGCFLYGVFNGYDGSRVASFASQRLTAELLLGQINSSHTDNDIRRILTQAFDVVEKSYFETIDDALAEKANLHHRCSNYQQQALHCQHWKHFNLKTLCSKIYKCIVFCYCSDGNRKVIIVVSGTNRALLCKSSSDGQNQVLQIGRPHTTDSEDELQRLAGLGVDSARVRQAGQIAGQTSTRRLGDYRAKLNYTDIDLLSAAKAKPIISEPEIHSSQSLDNISGFLVLMSEGLVAALEAAHGPEQVNQEIVAMVAAELAQQASIEAAAQSVVDRVKRLHHDVYVSGRQRSVYCSRHEDMTLLIRTINYPLADGGSRPRKFALLSGGRIYPVSVPYSNSQSTSKTSVTLSLVMPSQSTLTNGTNTASTLEEGTPTPGSQSPTATLQSTNTQTQSSSSSSGDGSLFHQIGSQAATDETGRVWPYVDFSQFYRLWGSDHSDGQSTQGG